MDAATVQPESLEAVISRYTPYLQGCRDQIATVLKATPATAGLIEYIEGGKRLRPLLAFLAASATGHDPKKMVKVAAALELLHGASLIHDDIVDETAVRRGRPALHVQVGLGAALVLGDYLILRSLALLREGDPFACAERVLAALHTLNHYARACCLGELEELLPSRQADPEAQYLTIVEGKTASQFAAAATVPVILGDGPLTQIEALRTYGLNLGIAFQIHDDVLDLIGDAAVMGKPAGPCLAARRPTLPFIYLERDGSRAARRTYRRLQGAEPGRREEFVALLNQEGILDRVQDTQDRYLALALEALDRLPPSQDVVALSVLASCATGRQTTETGTRIVRASEATPSALDRGAGQTGKATDSPGESPAQGQDRRRDHPAVRRFISTGS